MAAAQGPATSPPLPTLPLRTAAAQARQRLASAHSSGGPTKASRSRLPLEPRPQRAPAAQAGRTCARLPSEAPPHGLVCDGGGSPPFRSAPGRGAGVDSLPRCIRPHRRDLPPSSTPASAANRSTHHLGPLVNPHRLPHDSIPNLISLLLLFHSLGAQTRHRFASERGGATSRARRSRRGMAVARAPSACVWA